MINHLITICFLLSKNTMVGSLRFITDKNQQQFVQWTVNDKEHIKNVLLPLLLKYPSLTSRIHFQLQFLIQCINNNTVQNYIHTKNSKYNLQNNSFSLITNTSNLPPYFSNWLAGFIEAEGSFCIRNNKNYSFSIGQNHDQYLIEAIKSFYSSKVKVQSKKITFNAKHKNKNISNPNFYTISFASIHDLFKVITHCKPLLQGYKYQQMIEFLNKNPNLKILSKLLMCHVVMLLWELNNYWTMLSVYL